MKKPNRKALKMSLKAVLLTSAMMWASGQTAMAQTNSAVKNTGQNGVQQTNAKKPQPVEIQQRAAVNPAGKGAATNDKKVHPQSKEQLLFQRKQAADKGQPTADYDKAIIQLNINQAN